MRRRRNFSNCQKSGVIGSEALAGERGRRVLSNPLIPVIKARVPEKGPKLMAPVSDPRSGRFHCDRDVFFNVV